MLNTFKQLILSGLVIAGISAALLAVDDDGSHKTPYGLQNTEFVAEHGCVTLDFPCNKIPYNDFQLLKANYTQTGKYSNESHLDQPDAVKLKEFEWRRLLRGEKNRVEVSLPVRDAENRKSLYEVWGDYSHHGSKRDKDPKFLGYIKIIKQVNSFADFREQNQCSFFSKNPNEFSEKLLEQVDKKNYWIQDLLIILDSQKEPQKYQIEQLLGSGQDGYVLKAAPINNASNPIIAIKLWDFDLKNKRPTFSGEYQIKQEIEARGFLPNKNVAQLLSGQSQVISGMTGLIMEYIDGETLESFIDRKPTITHNFAKEMIRQILNVASGLKLYDLTRQNIMVEKQAEKEACCVKFIDFAKWEWGSSLSDNRISPRLDSIKKDIMNLVSDVKQD